MKRKIIGFVFCLLIFSLSSVNSIEENENNIESNNEIQDINNNVETTETIYEENNIISSDDIDDFINSESIVLSGYGIDPPGTTPPQNQIWFTPNLASVDMLDMFNQPEQWDSARSNIDVFKFYSAQVGSGGWGCVGNPAHDCGDNHLENLVDVQAFSKLGEWGIDIAIESFFTGPIISYDPIECSTSEYVYNLALSGSVNVIENVQSNGGTVRYLAMDEPIRQWYPQYYYIHTGQIDPRPCLVDSLGSLADHVAAYILQMQEWYPSVSIGHIELYPEVGIDQLKEWIIALEARGVSLPFLHIDVHGPRVDHYISLGIDIDVAADMLELKSFLEEHDIEFGIIFFDTYYDSQYWEPSEYNDNTYYAGTMNWVNFVHDANLKPDHSIFQSWVSPYYTTGIGPKEIPINLPEDDPTVYSHTRLINEALSILEPNTPPEKPDIPTGPQKGKPDNQYTFTTNTIDADGDTVSYMWDWGDGNFSEWLDTNEASYIWGQEAKFNISVRAKDIHGAESEWSDPLPISMPEQNTQQLNTLDINFTILTDKDSYKWVIEPIEITMEITNNDDNKIALLRFPTTKLYDIIIKKSNDMKIYQWSDLKYFNPVLTEILIMPGETARWYFSWDQRGHYLRFMPFHIILPGVYTIKTILPLIDEEYQSETSIEIKLL